MSLSVIIDELARLSVDCAYLALVPFIFSQIVTTTNQKPSDKSDTTEKLTANAESKPVVPGAVVVSREEALLAALDATQSEIDKHLRRAETNIFAASGNMQTLQNEISETGIIASLSGHTANLRSEHSAEYRQLLSAKAQRDLLTQVKDGDPIKPEEPSLSQIRKMYDEGKIDDAGAALEKLNEKLAANSIKMQNDTYLTALKSAQEEYHNIDSRLENAETTARVVRDGSVMLGAIVATGGGAGLAGLGVVGVGAVTSNVTEQVGHVALGNKTAEQATHDGIKQFATDAITIGSTVAGVKGATAVGTAGKGLAVTASGLAAVGATTSIASEASTLGMQIALGEKDSITSSDLKSLAVGAVGGAAGSLVGFSGGIGRAAVSGVLQKSGMIGAETAADVTLTAAEELTRSKLEGREITGDSIRQAGLNSLRSIALGEVGAYARNHSTPLALPHSSFATAKNDTTNAQSKEPAKIVTEHQTEQAVTTNHTRRNVDEIADALTKVNRQQIGNVQEIIAKTDIIRDSETDEIAPNQKNYAHGSAAVVQDILSRSNSTEATALIYYEGKELRTVNQLNHGAGDAYIRATNDAVRTAWEEINPQAQVFRGPNAAIIVSVPNMSAKEALTYHDLVQAKVQQQLSSSIEMQDKLSTSGVQLSGAMRAGASEIATNGVTSSESAKLSYYRALAEAGAAAEYEKKLPGSKPLSIAEIAAASNTDIDTVLRNNFNFIPPEAQPGTFFKVHEQKQTMQQTWDALVGPPKSFLDSPSQKATTAQLQEAAAKQRKAVADALAAGPTSAAERALHSAARIETVKYLAMTNRPGRFESNVQAVHDGTQVPIINTLAAERLQIDLLRNDIPVYRADGDADFLGPLFKNQQTDLKNGKRDLDTEIGNADLRYGELFNNSATQLKLLENQINEARFSASDKSTPVEPILFTLAKQSNSDEFHILVAGRDATPEHLRQAMQTVRNAFRDVGMQEPFEKVHKITGASLGYGGTTASLGTDYRSLNQAVGPVQALSDAAIVEHLKVVGKINDEITNLRKFTKLKDTSGDISEITPEQFMEVQDTMRDFVGMYRDQVLAPAIAKGESLTSLKASLEDVTNLKMSETDFQEQFGTSSDAVRKGLNALNDVENTLSAFGTAHNPSLNLELGMRGPNGAFGDVLQNNGFDVDAFRLEIDGLESSLQNVKSLTTDATGLFSGDSNTSLRAANSLTELARDNQLLAPTVLQSLQEARDAHRLLGETDAAVLIDEMIGTLDRTAKIGRANLMQDQSVLKPLFDDPLAEIQNSALGHRIDQETGNHNDFDFELFQSYAPNFELSQKLSSQVHTDFETQNLRSYTIGRGGVIRTPADEQRVSEIHSLIKPKLNDQGEIIGYRVFHDIKSSNGTLVDTVVGKAIPLPNSLVTLPSGTIVTLSGKSELKFLLPQDSFDIQASPAATQHIVESILTMKVGESRIIGRADDADLRLQNPSISRYQATVIRLPDDTNGKRSYKISDGIPRSTNGVELLNPEGTWSSIQGALDVPHNTRLRLGQQAYFDVLIPEITSRSLRQDELDVAGVRVIRQWWDRR